MRTRPPRGRRGCCPRLFEFLGDVTKEADDAVGRVVRPSTSSYETDERTTVHRCRIQREADARCVDRGIGLVGVCGPGGQGIGAVGKRVSDRHHVVAVSHHHPLAPRCARDVVAQRVAISTTRPVLHRNIAITEFDENSVARRLASPAEEIYEAQRSAGGPRRQAATPWIGTRFQDLRRARHHSTVAGRVGPVIHVTARLAARQCVCWQLRGLREDNLLLRRCPPQRLRREQL